MHRFWCLQLFIHVLLQFLTSLRLGHCSKLNWPKRVSAVYWLFGTLFYPCNYYQPTSELLSSPLSCQVAGQTLARKNSPFALLRRYDVNTASLEMMMQKSCWDPIPGFGSWCEARSAYCTNLFMAIHSFQPKFPIHSENFASCSLKKFSKSKQQLGISCWWCNKAFRIQLGPEQDF